ncbi:hypothetical protein ACEW7V_03325 [Areca yellow leaf disease phytoplasma]|uniref:hypothetical protein n=1 Tax=Areca yellow leaf disease phytoplasma TaxID=927614 RepID=UPI0035B5095D
MVVVLPTGFNLIRNIPLYIGEKGKGCYKNSMELILHNNAEFLLLGWLCYIITELNGKMLTINTSENDDRRDKNGKKWKKIKKISPSFEGV